MTCTQPPEPGKLPDTSLMESADKIVAWDAWLTAIEDLIANGLIDTTSVRRYTIELYGQLQNLYRDDKANFVIIGGAVFLDRFVDSLVAPPLTPPAQP